jgi:hypothetical protein
VTPKASALARRTTAATVVRSIDARCAGPRCARRRVMWIAAEDTGIAPRPPSARAGGSVPPNAESSAEDRSRRPLATTAQRRASGDP